MGAPGSYYWTGTIKVYNLTSDTFYSPNKEDVDYHRYSYLGESLLMKNHCVMKECRKHKRQLIASVSPGYAVTAGHFSSPHAIDIAAGAPQHSGSGKVGCSSSVLVSRCGLEGLSVAYRDSVSSCTGLHIQNRWCVIGEEFPSLREDGMSSNVLVFCFNGL